MDCISDTEFEFRVCWFFIMKSGVIRLKLCECAMNKGAERTMGGAKVRKPRSDASKCRARLWDGGAENVAPKSKGLKIRAKEADAGAKQWNTRAEGLDFDAKLAVYGAERMNTGAKRSV